MDGLLGSQTDFSWASHASIRQIWQRISKYYAREQENLQKITDRQNIYHRLVQQRLARKQRPWITDSVFQIRNRLGPLVKDAKHPETLTVFATQTCVVKG